MRADMHKVIVERPRNGGGADKPRRRGNRPLEELPKQESIYAAHSDRKRFSEHLGPLRRWLRSQIGRPWNDAYGEACRVIKPDNVVRAHIKFHLLEMVERNTFMRDGVVWCYHGSRFHSWTELPVETLGSRWVMAYVHPETGLICGLVFKRRRRFAETRQQPAAATRLWLVDGRVLLKLKGCWFVCEVRVFPERIERGDRPFRFDLATHRMLTRSAAESFYDRQVYCVAKRQLSRQELAAHRLRNDPLASLLADAFPPVVAGPGRPTLRLSGRSVLALRAGHNAGFPVWQIFRKQRCLGGRREGEATAGRNGRLAVALARSSP